MASARSASPVPLRAPGREQRTRGLVCRAPQVTTRRYLWPGQLRSLAAVLTERGQPRTFITHLGVGQTCKGAAQMDNNDLLRCIQARVARMAVGASAARGQGEGVVAAGRGFLGTLQLATIARRGSRVAFDAHLDRITNELRVVLPVRAQSWGLARKLVNIFLRDCAYTFHLREAHGLGLVEPLLEIPLDSITAKALLKSGGKSLPRWLGVKRLTPSASAEYQRVAQDRAAEMGIARVHLDAYWWAYQRSREGTGRREE